MKQMGDRKANSFQFKHLKLCHYSMAGVNKVVLASMPMPYMECGFARDLFLQWCSNPKNSVILTSKASPGSLARDLQDNGGDRTIPIEVKRRVKLVGQELEQFRANEKKNSSKLHTSLVEEALDSEGDSDEEMMEISKPGDVKNKHLLPEHRHVQGHVAGGAAAQHPREGREVRAAGLLLRPPVGEKQPGPEPGRLHH